MQILDLNQIFISNFMMNFQGKAYKSAITSEYSLEDTLRHMILNSIRSYNSKYRNKFGELIIACDDKNYWRRDYFQYYKWSRSKGREESEIDWETVFKIFDMVKQELIDYFPYRFIRVPKTEADDIIATLCFKFNEPTLIVSSDGDFKQLHVLEHVKQFDVLKKKIFKLSPEEAVLYLREHVLRGDGGDGIPNFLSQDDCFVNKIRQKSISSKKMEEWIKTEDMTKYLETPEMVHGYNRNRPLIDLTYIPKEITEAILHKYDSEAGKNRSQLFHYFATRNLKHLMKDISDF
jgi:hypothetical protein